MFPLFVLLSSLLCQQGWSATVDRDEPVALSSEGDNVTVCALGNDTSCRPASRSRDKSAVKVSRHEHDPGRADDTNVSKHAWPAFWDEIDVDLYRRHSVQNTSIIVVASIGYYHILRHWLTSVDKLQIHGVNSRDNVTVICSDKGLYDTLRGLGYEPQLMRARTPQARNMSHFPKFKSLSFTRHVVAAKLSREGLNIMYFDIDAIWLQNPLPDIFGQAHRDGRPGVVASRGMFPLEVSAKWGVAACTGVLFFYGSLGEGFWNALNRVRNTMSTGHDQQYFNHVLDEQGIDWDTPHKLSFKESSKSDHGIARGFNIHITLLPHRSFPRACEEIRKEDVKVLHCMAYFHHRVSVKTLIWHDWLELPYMEQPGFKTTLDAMEKDGQLEYTRATSVY